MTESATPKVYKNNYYSILDNELEDCDEEVFTNFQKHVQSNLKSLPLSANALNNNNASTSAATAASTTEKVENRNKNDKFTTKNNNKNIPPINVFDIEAKQIIKLLKEGLRINEFKIKEFNKNKITIYLSNIDDYKRVRGHLEKANAKFFSYTPKCLKTETYLMKGLNGNTDPKEILDELCLLQKGKLKISAESNVNDLKSIKTVLYHCIKWEPLRRPEITQCRNCQSFFHSSSNCHLTSRCVKCSDPHRSENCPLSKEPMTEKDKLYCVLCKKYGHSASYRGCERYKELLNRIKIKKQKLVSNINKNASAFINPNVSYANIVRDNSAERSFTNQNISNSFLEEIRNTMLALSNQMLQLQRQLDIQTARVDAICNLVDVV